MVTSSANALILNAVIDVTLDLIGVISLKNNGGEYFRKSVTDIIDVSASKKVFTFFISENEGNGNIVEIGLHGNGATTALGSGTEYATQAFVLAKTATQSLTFDWTVEVK